MDEIATKLLQANTDPNKYETTLTITGAGGFGKTTTVISLCHYPVVKNHFTDGFVFIELGPQATDPNIKLRDIHNLLTGEQCGINVVEQKINQLISEYYHNLLVIIDDVWHIEDAEPLVKAFSNCKTILTTRMNNIEQYIPSNQSTVIGPMEQNEAFSLLTSRVIDSSKLSQDDKHLLDELAQHVHLWPLLLCLIRGQLFNNLKQRHLSYHNAIQNVQVKLRDKGLTAFDKNSIEATNKSRTLAVKACIEISLESLSKSITDKLKTLILWTGIGTTLQLAVLDTLWNISEREADDTIQKLWDYGLVQYTDITISTDDDNLMQHCVQVHTIISQYIIERLDSYEAYTLSPMANGGLNTAQSVHDRLKSILQQSHEAHDPSSLTPVEFLNYWLSRIEDTALPNILKSINMFTVTDSYAVILMLQQINDFLMNFPHAIDLLLLIGMEINSLIAECKQTLRDVHKLSRKLNQSVQRNTYAKKFDKLIQTVEEFIMNYPICSIAQKAVTMVKKIIKYCDGDLTPYMKMRCEDFQMMTTDYHRIVLVILPRVKLYVRVRNKITSALCSGSSDIESACDYLATGKHYEEFELVKTNYFIKIQEVAPNYVYRQTLQK